MIEDLVAKALANGSGRFDEEHSPEVGELIGALCEASLEFGEVVKDKSANIPAKDGKSGYRYEYATLAAINAATDEPLAKHGLRIVQTHPRVYEPGYFSVITTLWHKSGQFFRSWLKIELSKSGITPQALGGLDTYLRRYGIRAMLNLAPVDDDDGAGEQSRAEESKLGAEALAQLAPRIAFGEVKKAIAAVGKCDDISPPRMQRLYAIASKEGGGWKHDQVDAACEKLLGIPSAARIPWKVYDMVVDLFRTVHPEVLRPEKDVADEVPPVPEAAPTWPGAWEKIAADHKSLPQPVAFLPKKDVDALLDGFARQHNWTVPQVNTVLRMELGISPQQIPADGSHPPVLKKIRQIFRLFGPGLVPAEDRLRYGWDKTTSDPEPIKPTPEEKTPWDDDPPANDGEPTVADVLSGIPDLPDTADEIWRGIKNAVEGLSIFHREALVPITPEDKIGLSTRTNNGGRSSADVAGLVKHHLGLTVDLLPALLYGKVHEALMAYPSRKAGREAPLLDIPADEAGRKRMQVREMKSLVDGWVMEGLIGDEEIQRSGDKQGVTKDDLQAAMELIRDRALMEAGAK